MANLNKVMLIGRLTRDPEIKTFGNGGKVANIGFAVNNRRKNKDSGQWEDVPVWLDLKVFNREPGPKKADLVESSLKKGQQISSIRARNGENQTFVATDDPIAPTIPLVLLTDGRSASASEIVAGALQDHDRALIVGTTSFGKGLVQSVFPLEGGYALKMTTAKWYTPNGRSSQVSF